MRFLQRSRYVLVVGSLGWSPPWTGLGLTGLGTAVRSSLPHPASAPLPTARTRARPFPGRPRPARRGAGLCRPHGLRVSVAAPPPLRLCAPHAGQGSARHVVSVPSRLENSVAVRTCSLPLGISSPEIWRPPHPPAPDRERPLGAAGFVLGALGRPGEPQRPA